MPANPKQLYDKLVEGGHLSISYADFRESWDTPGWNVDFHKALQQKQLTKMSYQDFVYTFSDDDPTWDAEKGIEITEAELESGEFGGKPEANEQDPENLAQNFTGFPMEDGELVSSDGKAYITKTDEEVAQELEIKLQKEKTRQIAKTEELNALYGNDLDARIAETANIKVDKGFEDYVADLEKGIKEKPEDKTADVLSKMMGSAGNIPIQLEAAWEGTKALMVAGLNESDGGGALADVLVGEASFFDTYELLDPVTNELVSFKKDRKRYFELQKMNRGSEKPIPIYRNGKPVDPGKAADKYVADQLKEIKKLNEGTFQTGSITEGFKEGSTAEVFAGTFNAVTSLAATMIPAALTGGASLAPQVITPMWVDYNTTKAMEQYGDEEDPIAAMIAADDTEFLVPLSLGAGALVLESVGFKGISKYMAGSKIGGSIMGIAKNQLAWMLTANKEGGTEWLQGGLETVNNGLASGKSMNESVRLAAKNMFSQDGLEQYLQGAFGSGVSTAPSAAKRAVQRALRSDPKGHKAIVEGINDIAKLKEARAAAVTAKNKVEVKLIDADIKAVETRIKMVVQENNTIFNHLSDAENKQLRSIAKEMDGIAADAAEVDAMVARGDISKMEGYQTKRKLQARHTVLSNDIAALKKNVNLSKLRSDVAMAQKFAENLPNLKLRTFRNKTDVRRAIDGALNEKGKPYTKAELDAFANESAGLFWTDAKGIEHIVINESKSAKAGLTTSGQHEFLHKVLSKVLKANPGLAVKMGGAVQALIAELGKKGQISGKKNPLTKKLVLEERLAEYQGRPKAEQAEELITILSEALESGDVKITEDTKSTFGGIKELVRRAFLDMGITSVKLDGDNVMQFIKDYNREFQRGRLSKATKNLLEGKRTGKAIREALKSKPTTKAGKNGGIKQSLDSREATFTWYEDTTGSFTTEPELVGQSEISLSIEKSGNKQLIEKQPALGLDPNKPAYTIAFQDEITEFDMTNRDEGLLVFGTVINGLKEKLNEIGAEQIIFSSVPEGNRQRLYTLMAATMAKKLGLNFESVVLQERISFLPKGDKVFVLTKPAGGIKQSKVDTGDLYERTNKLYQEYSNDLHTGGFLIGMEWQNQIESLAKKYRNLPGYASNIEDVVAYVMTANQGIPGLVNSFTPGSKTKDGKNEVSLEGWINKYLPSYINSALGKHGIGLAKEEGGFAADVTEVSNVTATETAEDSFELEGRESIEEKADGRGPQLKEAIKLESNPELKTDIENKVAKNISAAIKLFGKAKSRNEKIDGFIKATRQGIKNDEKAAGEMVDHILKVGVDNFLRDTKAAFIENSQRSDLQRSPLFKRVVQQKINGKWQDKKKVTISGKVSYEYLMEDGTPYPARHPDMDRDKMAETGTTAGHYKYRKAPNAASLISDGEFIESFYKDGAGRSKLNKPKLTALASQYSAEIGLEMFAEQLNNREGAIFDELSRKVELTSEMSAADVKAANEQKLIIREGMAAILTDKGIAETLKDLERGGIKQSKVNKTGYSWFDGPRIDMTNYLAGLENNDIRDGVVAGTITSPEYTSLYEDMKEAYDMYISMQSHQDQWADSLKTYAKAFADKDFTNFDAFVDDTLGQVKNSVDGILGTNPKDTSLGKKNIFQKETAKQEGIDTYINETLNSLKANEKSAALADIVKTLVGATSSTLYQNTPGFYREVVMVMVNAHGINPKHFSLVETETGHTIHYKGKKITSNYSRGVYADDTMGMFDVLAEGGKVIDNTVNVQDRIDEAKVSQKLYMNYVTWLKNNHKRFAPETIGIMLKALGGSSRSVGQIMVPLTKVMAVQQADDITSYTEVSSVPSKYINLATLRYIMTGKGLKDLNKLIDGAYKAIMPNAYAKVINQFHHSTPNNDFNSDKVNNKLNELNLPEINATELVINSLIDVVDLTGKGETILFNKTIETISQGMKQSKEPKGISVWDFDDTLAKTKSNVLYTLPGQTRIFHGGAIKSTKNIDGFVYFSEDQAQASAYAEGNEGEVNSFMLEESDIATEDTVFEVINSLGIKPQNGWEIDESHLYELIDPRFEQAFSKRDRAKLADALKKRGIKAARFTDTNIAQDKNGRRETENIVVFNKKAIKEQNKLTAAEFAAQSDAMTAEGVTFDFSEFSKIVKGEKGPLFDTAVKRNEKFGNEHVFILTARPQNSARAIHEFLNGIGLDVRIENITGLQDSSPQAKANWVNAKAAEGYNDFYFADDHIGNVTAVKEILESVDVKSDVVQAGMKQSKLLSKEFNKMLERTLKIEGLASQRILTAEGQQKGKKFDGKFTTRARLFVPPSAEDFMGLLYKFLGTGKQGNADMKWVTENLVDPYLIGIDKLDVMNTAITIEYKALNDAHPGVVKKLHDEIPGTDYTYDMAIRYYLYERSGFGDMFTGKISSKDGMKLRKAVISDKKIKAYADALSIASRTKTGYVEPDVANWLTQSIATDFRRLVTDAHRKKVLQKFIENTDAVFSSENLSKIQAVYGTKFKNALVGAIGRMKTGTNQGSGQGQDKSMKAGFDWLNGAIAPIMFLNQRSGLLQMLSTFNFINWTDNNPLKMLKTITNPKQFFADMVMILKSPKMVQRRDGLRFSIEEAELANLGGLEGGWGVFYKRMIKLGFLPTQIFDGLAIASGGASFYRNRVNTYLKEGMEQKAAEELAWKEFSEISDKAQQSSDQMLTSAEQSGGWGRVILAFANTPAQYTRIMKKAALDIANGRGDIKTNLSKIAYYGFLQNMIFSVLQTALVTAYGVFADDDEEERHEKYRKAIYDTVFAEARELRKGSTKPKNSIMVAKEKANEAVDEYNRGVAKKLSEKEDRVVNGMADSILRGLGVRGAVIASLKNTLLEILAQSDNRGALKEAEKETNIDISEIYQQVLSGSLSLEEAETAERQLKKALLEIDPGKPLYNTTKILLAAASISPPLSAKARDFNKILTVNRYNKDIIEAKGWSYDSPRWMQAGLLLKVATNLPGDYIPKKIEIIKQITQGDGTTSQKAMLGLGWSPYDLGLHDLEFERIEQNAKAKKKDANADRAKAKRDLRKLKEDAAKTTLTPRERKRLAAEAKRDRSAAGKKAAATRKRNKAAKNRKLWEEATAAAKLRKN